MRNQYIHIWMQPTPKKLLLLSAIVFIGIVAALYSFESGLFAQPSQSEAKSAVPLTFDAATTHWTQVITASGGREAYEEFLAVYSDESPGRQHQLAHVFGKVLYETEGIEGVSVCDQNFSFGCFHEFLGNAIHQEGIEVITLLNTRCVERLLAQALGCQHGIGHGIQAAVGYEPNDLSETLALCDSLPALDPIGGCKGGAFMEYNLRTLLGVDGEPRKKGPEESPIAQCDALSQMHHQACAYWIPQWWQSSDPRSEFSIESFKVFGEWCNLFDTEVLRSQCFRGIGNNAPGVAGWEVETLVNVCEQMPSTIANTECRGAASAALGAVKERRDDAHLVCEGISPLDKEQCLAIANLPDAGAIDFKDI